MRYDAILLDADDTIFDFVTAERAALKVLMDEMNVQSEVAAAVEAYHRINAACWRDFEKGLITQAELRVRRFREWLTEMGMDADPVESGERYVDALSRQGMLLPGALEAVKLIAAARPVALVTNGISKVQRGRLARSPIAPLIKAVVISGEVGAAKPDPKMFRSALQALGDVAPDRALMIGDSLSSDMAGAIASGVHTCWYNPGGLAAPEGMAIDRIITTIGEMPLVALE